jgi:hypothetical protein
MHALAARVLLGYGDLLARRDRAEQARTLWESIPFLVPAADHSAVAVRERLETSG